jgi:hypothetical protein
MIKNTEAKESEAHKQIKKIIAESLRACLRTFWKQKNINIIVFKIYCDNASKKFSNRLQEF